MCQKCGEKYVVKWIIKEKCFFEKEIDIDKEG